MPEPSDNMKINKWDLNAVKNALDDALKQAVTERYTNWNEKHTLLDYRLLISFVSVMVAGTALLWDWLHPFPTSRPVLVVCVLAYFALMGVLQLYAWFVEKGIFFMAEDAASKWRWSFSGVMKKYAHVYELEVAVLVDAGDERTATLAKSVAQWIDVDGNVQTGIVRNDVLRLVDSLQRKDN